MVEWQSKHTWPLNETLNRRNRPTVDRETLVQIHLTAKELYIDYYGTDRRSDEERNRPLLGMTAQQRHDKFANKWGGWAGYHEMEYRLHHQKAFVGTETGEQHFLVAKCAWQLAAETHYAELVVDTPTSSPDPVWTAEAFARQAPLWEGQELEYLDVVTPTDAGRVRTEDYLLRPDSPGRSHPCHHPDHYTGIDTLSQSIPLPDLEPGEDRNPANKPQHLSPLLEVD